MKKILSVVLLLAMCLSLFAACGEQAANTGLEDAKTFVHTSYIGASNSTPVDYEIMGVARVNGVEYKIEWTATSDKITFTRGENKFVTVHVPADNLEDIKYTLTGTISDAEGKTATVTFERVVPAKAGKPTEVTSGTYVIVSEGLTFSSLTQDKSYGYAPFHNVTVADGAVTGHFRADVLTITAVDGGFTMQDAYGRYFYLKGTYNSFNVSETAPEDGHIWQLLTDKDGNTFIVNKMNLKTLAYDTAYTSWGAYPEIKEGQNTKVTLIPATAPETDPETPNEPTTPDQPSTPSGEITTPVAGTAYKLGLYQGNKSAMLYFTGASKPNYPWYLLSTSNVAEAIDVYVEEVDGGLLLYFTIDGTKTYLDMHKDDTHYSLQLTTEPVSVYTWNTEYNTFVAKVDDKDCFIGTYNTYDTFSCNKMDGIATSFVAHLYPQTGATAPETPDEPEKPAEKPGTLAEQIAEANKLSNGAYLTYESTITGTITDDPIVGKQDATAYKFTVSDGTNTILCYYVPVNGVPAKGDTITVTGKLTAYNGSAQFDKTATATLGGASQPSDVVIADGSYVLVVDGKAMTALAETKNYGYMPTIDVTVANGVVTGSTANEIFVIKNVEGGFTIQDCYGRYMYMSGTYNNFNMSATVPAEGHIWTATATEGGFIITNVLKGKSLVYGDGGYTTFGAYTDKSSVVSVIAVAGSSTPETPDEPEKPEEPESNADATIAFDDKANRTVFTDTQQVWAMNGITVTNDQGESTSAMGDYAAPVRFYASSALKIEYTGMKTIKIYCNRDNDVKSLMDSIPADAGITVTSEGKVVTITFTDAVDSFVVAKLAKQIRVDKIEIFK